MTGLGMSPAGPTLEPRDPSSSLVVQLDGKILGYLSLKLANAAVSHLRAIKAAKLAEEENMTPGSWALIYF